MSGTSNIALYSTLKLLRNHFPVLFAKFLVSHCNICLKVQFGCFLILNELHLQIETKMNFVYMFLAHKIYIVIYYFGALKEDLTHQRSNSLQNWLTNCYSLVICPINILYDSQIKIIFILTVFSVTEITYPYLFFIYPRLQSPSSLIDNG